MNFFPYLAVVTMSLLNNMGQLAIIAILFLSALAYLGYAVYKNFRADAGCSSGCTSCGIDISKIKKELEQKGLR